MIEKAATEIVNDGERCYHGGKLFDVIGNGLDTLEKSEEMINADVLDAWFSPSPKVISALKEHLSWIIKTAPPTHCEGLIKNIAKVRGILEGNILIGNGSSSLMYLTLPQLLNKNSKVLILNPTYGEYDFIFKNVIGCKVEWFNLYKNDDYLPNVDLLIDQINREKYDLFVLVNPNSPTGQCIDKKDVQNIINNTPNTFIWIDETYIDYTGNENSAEQLAANSENAMVCKSMSKVYALSGLRCAYLVANKSIIKRLEKLTPPWTVSFPAQIAGINALNDFKYYSECYRQTHENKSELINELQKNKELYILKGSANSILCEVDDNIDINSFIQKCEERKLFIRNASNMGNNWGDNFVRIAIKDKETNKKIARIIDEVLNESKKH